MLPKKKKLKKLKKLKKNRAIMAFINRERNALVGFYKLSRVFLKKIFINFKIVTLKKRNLNVESLRYQ